MASSTHCRSQTPRRQAISIIAELCVGAFRPGKEKGKEKELALFVSQNHRVRSVRSPSVIRRLTATHRREKPMLHRLLRVTGLLVVVLMLAAPLARAQTAAPAPPPDALAAAKDLVTTMHLV